MTCEVSSRSHCCRRYKTGYLVQLVLLYAKRKQCCHREGPLFVCATAVVVGEVWCARCVGLPNSGCAVHLKEARADKITYGAYPRLSQLGVVGMTSPL